MSSTASDDQHLAIDYASAFLDSGMHDGLRVALESAGLFDVSFVSNDSDLSTITKRAHLLANNLIISQEAGDTEKIAEFEDFKQVSQCIVTELRLHGSTSAALGGYLRACMPLIEAGQMFYYPRISVSSFMDIVGPDSYADQTYPWGHKEDRSILQLFDMIVSGRSIVRTRPESNLARRLFEPVLTIDLPYLENTTLYDFCRIAADESSTLDAARSFFRSRALAINEVDGHPDSLEVAKLSVEIQEGVRAISSEVRQMRRKAAVQASGAAIATVSATLVAVLGKDLANYLSILGASGGLWGTVQAADSYAESKSRVRDRPFYFLWLLSRHATKP